LQFDGCSLSKPYHCANRECAESADQCERETVFDESLALKRRLQSENEQGGPRACYENCHSQIKAATFRFTVPSSSSSDIVLATDSKYVVQAKLAVPTGAMASNTTTSSLYVRAVGDSRIRYNVNKVAVSRRAEHDGHAYLTYPNTLLSLAFECVVDEGTPQPFRVPLSVTARIDMNSQLRYQDVCLASIYEMQDMDFRAWQCVDKSEAERRANPVRSAATNLTESEGVVKGTLYSCEQGKMYGFIYAPLRAETGSVSDPNRWFADNLIYLVLGVVGISALVAFIAYLIKRLHRYRSKYHEERKAVEAMQEEVDNMEQFGGSAGRKDDEVEMQQNPLVIQMRDMQAALDARNNELKLEEARVRDEESAARREAIEAMMADRDKMAKELEKLRAELDLVSVPPQSHHRIGIEEDMPPSVMAAASFASLPPLSTVSSMSSAAVSEGTVVPTSGAAFNAARPKKKKNVD